MDEFAALAAALKFKDRVTTDQAYRMLLMRPNSLAVRQLYLIKAVDDILAGRKL